MVVSWGIDGSLGAASGEGTFGASAAGDSAGFVEVSAGFADVSAGFADVSAAFAEVSPGGVGGGSGCAGDGVSYGVRDEALDFAPEAEEALEDDEPESVLGLAAAGFAALAPGLAPLAAGLAATAVAAGQSSVVESKAEAIEHNMEEERLGVMAVLSNAKATGWSRPVMGASPS
jgi:hypothetical protein